MEKITLNKDLEAKVREYARRKKISFQKACEKLFDIGVCHLSNEKKTSSFFKVDLKKDLFVAGVCHLPRVKRVIIVEVA